MDNPPSDAAALILLKEMAEKLNQYLEHRRDCALYKYNPNGAECTCGFNDTMNDFRRRINEVTKKPE